MADPTLYTVGGTVQAGGGIYIPRQADRELLQLCRDRVFAYVLTPRQMGKSSLMVQTAEQLQTEGIRTAIVDLQDLGTQVTAEQWYFGFLVKLEDQLELETDVVSWWQERQHLGVSQRLTLFFREVLLTEIAEPLVIFVDEIDSTLSLDFTDDFFVAIRYLYVARTQISEFQRLSFVLVGVATPGDLIHDPRRTPFNIGQRVDIKGFELDEAQPLAAGFADKVSNPEAVLETILSWTGGQPFLTQKVCKLILLTDSPLIGDETNWVEQLVHSNIIENWEAQDEQNHLRTIRDRLLQDGQRASRLLNLYQKILKQGKVFADVSPEQMALRLSGLVIEEQGQLKVFNKIYQAVFGSNWVGKTLAELRPYAEALEAWLASDCKDESRLLRGQALQDALAWSTNKSLGDQDYQFLAASQELERQNVQTAWQAEKQANQILAEAQQKAEIALEDEKKARQRLEEIRQNTQKTMRAGLIGLAGISSAAAAMVGAVNTYTQNRLPELKDQFIEFSKPSVVRVQANCAGAFYHRGTFTLSQYGGVATGFFVSSNGYIITRTIPVNEAECKEQLFNHFALELKRQGIDAVKEGFTQDSILNLQYTRFVTLSKDHKFQFEAKEASKPLGEGMDVSVIKIDVENAPTLKLGSSDRVQLKDEVIALGFLSKGLPSGKPSPSEIRDFFSDGSDEEVIAIEGRIFNSLKIQSNIPVLQVDMKMEGLSVEGSPILNTQGEVIGMFASTKSSREAINLLNLTVEELEQLANMNNITPLAISSTTIRKFIQDAGISNEQSKTDELYHQGLTLFWKGDYKGAKEKFEVVKALFPAHSQVDRLIAESTKTMAEQWSNPNIIFWSAILLSITITIFSLGYLGYLFKQRRSI